MSEKTKLGVGLCTGAALVLSRFVFFNEVNAVLGGTAQRSFAEHFFSGPAAILLLSFATSLIFEGNEQRDQNTNESIFWFWVYFCSSNMWEAIFCVLALTNSEYTYALIQVGQIIANIAGAAVGAYVLFLINEGSRYATNGNNSSS